jgi:DNA-binding NarL/FixJ family response regulator
VKTLLADDHPLMREGVRQVLSQREPPVEIVDAHDYPSLFAQTALRRAYIA